ncbi:hypothetical protein ACOGYG_003634 [Edwardsiella piscicida]|uniref:hypothetical protein n=1 Tax=Enterobacterales TaxID=91347 RepID=UPI0006650C74|nr:MULTISPECIES: hypothetical protein [Enterobacterales]EKS7778550.1 hypothetical protein [Edwardsiella piscicida]EKS7782018.1 hypothetical protein [Edwardsiella piscicida]UCQ25194.1 hypothetical protein DCE91_03905 [Edwardsiella piscicida]UCQ35336.1 hypothetical protein DCF34_03905 [Edwardsiella piscicida]UCQ45242.1 hypothetical protein DCF39_03910 [Edwardsiella piscicida]
MAWQGIPYLLGGSEVFHHSDLVLRQIPKIVIESDSSWVIFASICSAIVAGGLPAFVAWRAIRANAISLQYQMKKHEEVTKYSLKIQVESSTQKEYITTLVNTAAEIAAYSESLRHIIRDIKTCMDSENFNEDRYHDLLDMKKASQREFATRSWRLAMLLNGSSKNFKVFQKGSAILYEELANTTAFNINKYNQGLLHVRDGLKGIINEEKVKLASLTKYD